MIAIFEKSLFCWQASKLQFMLISGIANQRKLPLINMQNSGLALVKVTFNYQNSCYRS